MSIGRSPEIVIGVRHYQSGVAPKGTKSQSRREANYRKEAGKNVISYTAAKTGLAGLVRGLSNELLPLGIRVNGIAPGFIETDINERVRQDKERFQFLTSRIPAGKWSKPEDLAGTTLFLSAPASDYVSGVVIPVDGGYLAN